MKKKIWFSSVILGVIFTPIISIAATTTDGVAIKIPKPKRWNEVSSSKITNGEKGTIFQARNGDLYAMGNGSKLQVLKNGKENFEEIPSSNIIDGAFGTIFQASNGDLYVMGNGSKLQVLKNGKENFEEIPSSNIIDGAFGTIFQASNGDLYVMGNDSKLQVLKEGKENFEEIPSSNINDGANGTIFQASNGDLYAMANDSKLQVLKNGEDNFEVVGSSNINDGYWGTIFQASNGDLYAMANDSKLQVLKNGKENFEEIPSSNIIDGTYGTIFQASNGDLYAMANDSKLQVLKNGKENFEEIPSSNIIDGAFGTIFQASNGDLYAMGSGSKLQVLKEGQTNFIDAPGTNVDDGYGGTIFQASNGDLYAMGFKSKLEVLKNGEDNFIDVRLTNIHSGKYGTIFQASNGDLYAMGSKSKLHVSKNNLEFEITNETSSGTNDGIIKVIKNFINHYSKLQYKNNLASEWTDLPSNGKIINLAPGTYNFQWVGKYGESYTDGSYAVDLSDQTIKTFTDAQIEANINIQKVTNKTASPPTRKKIVKYQIIPNSSDLNAPTQNGFIFEFKEATLVNDLGTSNVIYTVNVYPKIVGTITKDITFTVSHFQTKADAITEANINIKKVTNKTASPPTRKKIVKYQIIPNSSDLNAPTQNGFIFEFKEATLVNDLGTSNVIYTVNVYPKIVGTITKDITFTVSHFQTKADAITEANINIKKVTNKTASPPTRKKIVKYQIIPNSSDLNVPTQKGFIFEFKEATLVNDLGTSNVIYTVNVYPKIVGTITKDITFTVSHFQTKADAITEANINIKKVTNKTASPPTRKKIVKYQIIPNSSDLNAPTQNGFIFEFKEATLVNDLGTSNVIYTVNVYPKIVGTITKDITFTVSHFQTKADAITEANINIKKVTNKTASPPTRKKIVKYQIIPNSSDLNVPTQKGFIFSFKSATTVNKKKESSVIYTVDIDPAITGTTTSEITFVVGDFETKVKIKDTKVKTNNQKIILATTIPIGLISLIVIIWLFKHFFFKSKKKHKKIK